MLNRSGDSGHLCLITYLRKFAYVEPLLYPWHKADLVMVDTLSDMLLDSVCHYFIEEFYVDIHEGKWPIVLLCGSVFVWF
jgi:hypothetical protein